MDMNKKSRKRRKERREEVSRGGRRQRQIGRKIKEDETKE